MTHSTTDHPVRGTAARLPVVHYQTFEGPTGPHRHQRVMLFYTDGVVSHVAISERISPLFEWGPAVLLGVPQ
jgi:hypothetical protein